MRQARHQFARTRSRLGARAASGWFALSGDFSGVGVDGIAVVNPANEGWFVRVVAGPGAPSFAPFAYGQSGTAYYPPLGRGFFDSAFLPPSAFGVTKQLTAPLVGTAATPFAFGSATFDSGPGFVHLHAEGYGLPAGDPLIVVAFKPGVATGTILGPTFVNPFGAMAFTSDSLPSLNPGDVISVFAFGTPLLDGRLFVV